MENHFSEMKREVGMSPHEKAGDKRMSTPKQKLIHNPHPYIFVCVIIQGSNCMHAVVLSTNNR